MKEKTLNELKERKGISLIVLILTIIIIIILATAIIQSFSSNNPIEKAKEAKFKNDVRSIQEELEMAKLNSYFGESEDITIDSLTSASNYNQKFVIKNGEIKYIKNKLTSEEIVWVKDLGLNKNTYILGSNKNDGVTISETGILSTNWNGTVPEEVGSDIVIPNKIDDKEVRRIGAGAFDGCRTLTSVKIEDGVSSMEGRTFASCSSLEEVILPSTITGLAPYCFSGCDSLKEISIPKSVTNIGSHCFWYSGLLNIVIPDEITEIESYAFFECSDLKNVVIGSGVTKIAESSFVHCKSLKSIIINGNARFTKAQAERWFYFPNTLEIDMGNVVISGTGYKGEVVE